MCAGCNVAAEVGRGERSHVERDPEVAGDGGRTGWERGDFVHRTHKVALPPLHQEGELLEEEGGRGVGRDGGKDGQGTAKGHTLGGFQYTVR